MRINIVFGRASKRLPDYPPPHSRNLPRILAVRCFLERGGKGEGRLLQFSIDFLLRWFENLIRVSRIRSEKEKIDVPCFTKNTYLCCLQKVRGNGLLLLVISWARHSLIRFIFWNNLAGRYNSVEEAEYRARDYEKLFHWTTTLTASFSRLRFHLLGLRKFQDKLDIPSVRDRWYRTTMAGIKTR